MICTIIVYINITSVHPQIVILVMHININLAQLLMGELLAF